MADATDPNRAPHLELVAVPEWPKPRGYSNGVVGEGRVLFVAGQIAFDVAGVVRGATLTEQFGFALDNVLAVVRAAGGRAEHVARLTVYVTDLPAYRGALREIGAAYRARMGKHFPAMALVGVAGLVEARALVEIEATAVLPGSATMPAP